MWLGGLSVYPLSLSIVKMTSVPRCVSLAGRPTGQRDEAVPPGRAPHHPLLVPSNQLSAAAPLVLSVCRMETLHALPFFSERVRGIPSLTLPGFTRLLGTKRSRVRVTEREKKKKNKQTHLFSIRRLSTLGVSSSLNEKDRSPGSSTLLPFFGSSFLSSCLSFFLVPSPRAGEKETP